jgi:BirA family biotin operon repressor/biotin-[acetyl-CoA-carboxylase] ligase
VQPPFCSSGKSLAIDWSIETYDSVESTQDIAHAKAKENTPEGFVAQALQQTGGRGRHGRTWVSEPGNLYMSVLLRPDCSAQKIGQLSILLCIALAETISPHLKNGSDLMLKWPNDILLAGKKSAGVLIETGLSENGMIDYAVLGIGMNIAHAPAEGIPLDKLAIQPVSPERFRDQFLENLASFYHQWQKAGFDEIRQKWLALAHAKTSEMQVKIGTRIEKGRFETIDEEGGLILIDASGQQKKVTAGEVYLINTPVIPAKAGIG